MSVYMEEANDGDGREGVDRVHEWLTRLRHGEVEVLVDVLDSYGASMLRALGRRSEADQVAAIERALRGLSKQAARYKGGDPSIFVAETLGRFAGVPAAELTTGGQLDRQIKMRVIQRLARIQAETGRRNSKLNFVGLVAMVLVAAVSMVFVVGKGSSHSKLAATLVTGMTGEYGSVQHAAEAKAWVLFGEVNGERAMTHISQPGHGQGAGITLGTQPLPEGDLLGVFPDGSALLDDGSSLQRVGLNGIVWTVRRPKGAVQALSNGLIICFDRWSSQPDFPVVGEPEGSGKVTVLEYTSGGRIGEAVTLPIKQQITFLPRGSGWVAVSGDNPVVAYTSSGDEIADYSLPPPYEQASLDRDHSQIVRATRKGEVVAYDYAGTQLWMQKPSIPSLRDNGFIPNLIEVTGEVGGWLFVFDASEHWRRQANATLGLVSPDGRIIWKQDYASGGPGNPVFLSADGQVVLHTITDMRNGDYVQVRRVTDGAIICRMYNINLRWGDCADDVSAVVDDAGITWILVVDSNGKARVYRATKS